MSVLIDKDTKIYCSFSLRAGNKGCQFFNKAFSDRGINAIYKSFSVDNIFNAILSAKTLRFSGFAVSMPYKKQIVTVVDKPDNDDSAEKSHAVNTVIIDYEKNKLFGYNTDYYGAIKILTPLRNSYEKIYILGNGGLSGAVQATSRDLAFEIEVITRNKWNKVETLRNSLIYNCTPLNLNLDNSNHYIDCSVETVGGDLLHKYQSHKQFELYTGIKIHGNI